MGIYNSDSQQKALISMQNGDVYTVAGTGAALLGDFIEGGGLPDFLKITDIKSGNEVYVHTSQISSVVVIGDSDGRG